MTDAPPALLVPEDVSADGLLEAFLTWTEARGLELYDAQEEAILELFEGNNVVLNTPTGSGKSLVAVAAHFRASARDERSFYTSPIKALVSEKFFDLCKTLGAEHVGMMTGDGTVNADAPIICCTAEVLASMALRDGAGADVQSVVMDEFHYYSDKHRGTAWQVPLLILDCARFLLMSATLGDTTRIADVLEELTGAPAVVVTSDQRPVPLVFEYAEDGLTETISQLVKKERAPVYLVNFSQREASSLADGLTNAGLADKDRRRAIRAALSGFRFDTPYGKKLQRYLENGIGVHHAGLLPKYRLLVERLAQQGLLLVISGTDTLGVGVNVPIRTVLFTRLYKYDGDKSAQLTVRDFKQIAGRAGRRGYDDKGWVVAQAPAHVVENRRKEAKVAAGKMPKKKFHREQPPKGYVAYDKSTFRRLIDGQPEELTSVFSVDHGMLLSTLQRKPEDCGRDGGFGELLALIERSHGGPVDKQRAAAHAEHLLTNFVQAGLVVEEPPGAFLDGELRLRHDVEDDFSLWHSLSLFVIDAIEALDDEDEDHPLHVLSLVESILESPGPILGAQKHRARGELISQLKAEGVEYFERMEALEEVEYPKPDADRIYDAFNDYVADRPWLATEHVRPKGIAREVVETWCTFVDFVRDLKLSASEGVVLRYLSQVVKTLARTLPEALKTDGVVQMTAYLRDVVAHTDASLITEWEKLLDAGEPEPAAPAAPVQVDISKDRRRFLARLRAELHGIVRALSRKDWADAAVRVRETEDAWSPTTFEQALAPFFEDYGRLRFDHVARLSEHTVIREVGDHRWELCQHLLDVDGYTVWTLDGEVDLSTDRAPEGPLIEVVRIGE